MLLQRRCRRSARHMISEPLRSKVLFPRILRRTASSFICHIISRVSETNCQHVSSQSCADLVFSWKYPPAGSLQLHKMPSSLPLFALLVLPPFRSYNLLSVYSLRPARSLTPDSPVRPLAPSSLACRHTQVMITYRAAVHTIIWSML